MKLLINTKIKVMKNRRSSIQGKNNKYYINLKKDILNLSKIKNINNTDYINFN